MNVLVNKNKIDILANAISVKSGEPVTMTLDEMVEAVDGIENNPAPTLQAKTYTVDSAGTATVTADSGYDGLSSVAVSVPSAEPFVGYRNDQFFTENGQRKWSVDTFMEVDVSEGDTEGWLPDGYSQVLTIKRSAVPSNTTITPTTSAQTIGGANTMMEGAVTVNAVPMASFYSETVPLGYSTENNKRVWKIKAQTELDPGEGDTEGWISAGFYDGGTRTYNAIAQNTTITPTTSSQTIGGSNYMMEGAVTVSAMPSMTLPTAASGTATGTRKATIASSTSTQYINIPTGYNSANAYYQLSPPSAMTLPTTTSGTSTGTLKATVTPSTANKYINIPTGYNSSNAYYTVSGDANLIASNIKSGTSIFGVTGSYTGGGGGDSKNVQVLQSTSRTNSSSLTKVLGDLTVSKSGTYDIYWSGGRTNTSTSYTWGTRLYIDGTGYGTENTTWTNNCQSNHLSNVSLTANQKLSVYARGRSGSYYTFAPMLVIIEA